MAALLPLRLIQQPVSNSLLPLVILLALLVGMMTTTSSQEYLSWDILAEVTWAEEYDEELGITNITGTYSDYLKAYDGKEVVISGYVIPLDALGLSYALSRTSFAACFFCGQAGPETVMDLNVTPKSVPSHRQKDQLIKFKGILRLKESNQTGLHYTLDQASEVK